MRMFFAHLEEVRAREDPRPPGVSRLGSTRKEVSPLSRRYHTGDNISALGDYRLPLSDEE